MVNLYSEDPFPWSSWSMIKNWNVFKVLCLRKAFQRWRESKLNFYWAVVRPPVIGGLLGQAWWAGKANNYEKRKNVCRRTHFSKYSPSFKKYLFLMISNYKLSIIMLYFSFQQSGQKLYTRENKTLIKCLFVVMEKITILEQIRLTDFWL